MRRASIAAAGLALLVFTAGCGGSSSGSSPEVDAVTHVYVSYIDAVKAGDGATACRLLAPAYRRQAATLATPQAQAKVKGASCPRAIKVGTLRTALAQLEPRLQRVVVKGDRASGFQPAEGALGAQRVLFRRFGKDWNISGTIYQRGGPTVGGPPG
jgi:hypothetical protein